MTADNFGFAEGTHGHSSWGLLGHREKRLHCHVASHVAFFHSDVLGGIPANVPPALILL